MLKSLILNRMVEGAERLETLGLMDLSPFQKSNVHMKQVSKTTS